MNQAFHEKTTKLGTSSTADRVYRLARLTLELLMLLVALLLALAVFIHAQPCSAGFEVHSDGGCPALALLANAFPCFVAHLGQQLETPASRFNTEPYSAAALLNY